MSPVPSPRGRGFSLVEMLVVISIMAVLIFVTIPVLPSLLGARGMNKAVTEIYDLLELARNQALTSSQHTFVCFQNTKTAAGEDELTAFVFVSMVSRPSIGPSTKMLNDVQTVTAMHRWESVRMVPWSSLNEKVQQLRFAGAATKSLISQPPLTVAIGNLVPEPAALSTLAFTPQGKAMFYSSFTTTDGKNNYTPAIDFNTPYERFVDLALIPTRSGAPDPNNPDQAALVLNGASGHIQILRH